MDAVTRFLERCDALLPRLDEQLRQAGSPAEAASAICDFTGRELNLADCVVYLPADNTLVQTAAWGSRRGAERMPESRLRLPIGSGVAGQCALQLQVQRISDTRGETHHADDAPTALSELAVPLLYRQGLNGQTLLGVLDSESPEAGFYDARYEAAFAAIADCGARRLWQLASERALIDKTEAPWR